VDVEEVGGVFCGGGRDFAFRTVCPTEESGGIYPLSELPLRLSMILFGTDFDCRIWRVKY
jgi:hypothetical protein